MLEERKYWPVDSSVIATVPVSPIVREFRFCVKIVGVGLCIPASAEEPAASSRVEGLNAHPAMVSAVATATITCRVRFTLHHPGRLFGIDIRQPA
ncbi:hypothetical protein JCM18882A_32910 [Brevibacterium metallidurans]|uniref:Uncharacterized protein n=1 Tax=Brevibacterium metallidurans TaxID=1482676 RepID=A0ABP3CBR3_9MICO